MAQLQVYKASAGSGKTFRLALQFIESLLRTNTDEQYAHILGVTFTNKATAEMKDRILATLYGIAHRLNSSQAYYNQIVEDFKEEGLNMTEDQIRNKCGRYLTNILHDYHHFRVQTIDSFFQTILKGMAYELGLNANLQVDLNNDQVLDAAVDRVIDNVNDNHDIYLLLYRLLEDNIEQNLSWDVAGQLKKFGQVLFKEDYLLRSDKLHAIVNDKKTMQNFEKELKRMKQDVEDECQQLQQSLKKLWNNHPQYHDKIGYANILLTFIEKLTIDALQGISFSATMEKWINNADTLLKGKGPHDADAEAFAATLSAQLGAAKTKVLELQHTLNSLSLAHKNLLMLSLLGYIDTTIADINDEASRFNLSKTQILLSRMIQNDDASFVFEKIGALLQEVLIDEFQDTSMLQWKNFCSLLLETAAKGGHNFLVGDVKQSIYRWRGGDWSILGNINHSHFNVKVQSLDTNRRSRRNIVYFNNAFFDSAVSFADEHTSDIRKKLAVSFSFEQAYENHAQYPCKQGADGYVRVGVVSKEKDVDGTKLILNDLKAQVRKLIKSGLQPQDITILVRKNREAASIIEAFSEENDLPKIVSDEVFLLASSEVVVILIEMLRLTENPADEVAAYYLQNRGVDVQEVKRMAANAQSVSIYDLLEDFYRSIDMTNYPGQDAYVFCFMDAVVNFMHTDATDIHAFLKYWDEKLKDEAIPSAQVDGIRIISVHKSKGLEFHTVMMPFAFWEFYSPQKKNITWCDLTESPYDQMYSLPIFLNGSCANSVFARDYANDLLMTMLEELNILYVAFTRAESNLYVWTTDQQLNETKPSFSAATFIHAIVNEDFIIDKIDKPDETMRMETVGADVSTEEGTDEDEQGESQEMCIYSLGEFVGRLTEDTKVESRMEPIPKAIAVEKSSISPSLVFCQSNQSEVFCRQFDEHKPDADDLQREAYMEQGSLLHRVLQDIRTEADIPQALDALEIEGLVAKSTSESRTSVARSTVETLLHKGLQNHQVRGWFSNAWKVMNECTILSKNFEGTVQTRRPDRVMINADASRILVVDFKFGNMRTEYKEQVSDYMNLLREMYPDATVEGYLWFVYANHVEAIK